MTPPATPSWCQADATRGTKLVSSRRHPEAPSWCQADATPRHQAGVILTPSTTPSRCHADAAQDTRPESTSHPSPAVDVHR